MPADPDYHDDYTCLRCGHSVLDEFHTRLYEKWDSRGITTPQRTLDGKLLRVWIHGTCRAGFKHPYRIPILTVN